MGTTMKQDEQDQERKVKEGKERRGVARRWIDYVGLWNSEQRVDYEVQEDTYCRVNWKVIVRGGAGGN